MLNIRGTILLFLIILLFSACDVTENQAIEKQKVNFTINELNRQLSKTTETSYDLTTATKAIISLSVNDIVKYEEIELSLINWGDGETFRTDILEVEANVSYSLTQFELRDNNNQTLFAAPIEGAPFANLVNNPLPIPVNTNTDEQKAISVEVLTTESSSPSDFGYPYFDVKLKSKEAFSITVKAEGNLIGSHLRLSSNEYVFEKDLSLGKNIINFDVSYENYILEISNSEFNTYIDTINIDNLLGKHFNIELVNNGGVITYTDLSEWSDYTVRYVDIFPNEENTGIKGVGLNEYDLISANSIHIYNIDKIYHIIDGKYINITDAYPDNLKYDREKNELIIENMNISDGINIIGGDFKNIIIRKCYITNGLYGVNCKNSDNTFVTIEDCTITSPEGTARKGILANNCIVKRCNISRYQDGIYWINNAIIESNYIHDLHTFQGAHADGLQGAGENIIVVNNYVDVINHNACVMTSDQTGPMDKVWIEHNYFRGGNYVVYVRKAANPYVEGTYIRNVTLKNNIFEKEAYRYGYLSITENLGVVISGNVDENGNLHNFNN